MISRSVIDEIIARTDIRDLISSYVQLKRAGSNYSGLCPFHSEKTPSFTVYPSDNSFYCFGCGVGGNAITFAKKIENLDFEDAVEFLGRRIGINVIREDEQYDSPVKRYDKKRFYQMNVDAAKFFHAELFRQTPKANEAYAYFSSKRRLSDATIKHFGLGYCPDFGALANYMQRLGYTEEELTVGYLCGKSKNGNKLYDYYHGRVMFPIIDVSGNVIAFGGRVLDDSKPKYINSSDTPVFNKKRNLFALNYARHTCSEEMILCEGYMDVIALHAVDITNAVATLGTAITPEQARLMKRYTKRVIISYDTDAAGRAASDKATRLLEEAGLEVKLLKMPPNCGAKDPDEYIRLYGRDKFRAVINESRSKFNYYFENSLSHHEVGVAQEKIKVLNEMCSLIATYPSAAERDVYARVVSDKLNVDLNSLRSDITRTIAKRERERTRNIKDAERNLTLGIGDKVNVDFAKDPSIARIEESVLGLLLLFPQHRKTIYGENPSVTEDDFFTEFGKKVFSFIKECVNDFELDMLDAHFTPEEVGRITKLKISRMMLTDNGDNVFRESVKSLKNASGIRRSNSEKLTSVAELDDFINSLDDN